MRGRESGSVRVAMLPAQALTFFARESYRNRTGALSVATRLSSQLTNFKIIRV